MFSYRPQNQRGGWVSLFFPKLEVVITEFKTKERRIRNNRFYGSKTWNRIRRIQLRKNPLCQMCFSEKPRKLSVAKICDHVRPDWDSWETFVSGPFQSLCEPCHRHKTEFFDLPLMLKLQKTKEKGVNI